MKKFTRQLVIITTLLVFALSIQSVYAQPILPKPKTLPGPTAEQQEATKGEGGKTGGYGVKVTIPFITNVSISFAGSFALISFIYGGLLYVVAYGDEGQIEKGKKIMIWAAVGLGVAMLSYALVATILKIRIN